MITATRGRLLPLARGLLIWSHDASHRRTFVLGLLGVAYSTSLCGIATLVGSPPNAFAAAEVGLSFSEWMALGLPMTLLLLPVAAIGHVIGLKAHEQILHNDQLFKRVMGGVLMVISLLGLWQLV